MACECKGLVTPIQSTSLTMNHDVFSAEILTLASATNRCNTLPPVACFSAQGSDRKDHARSCLRVYPRSHAALQAFVAVFRALRDFLRAGAAVFLALGAALTTDGNSRLGCFAVR